MSCFDIPLSQTDGLPFHGPVTTSSCQYFSRPRLFTLTTPPISHTCFPFRGWSPLFKPRLLALLFPDHPLYHAWLSCAFLLPAWFWSWPPLLCLIPKRSCYQPCLPTTPQPCLPPGEPDCLPRLMPNLRRRPPRSPVMYLTIKLCSVHRLCCSWVLVGGVTGPLLW